MKKAFDKLVITKVREELQNIDSGCPHTHHIRPRGMDESLACTEVTKAGHPLPCASGMCGSKYEFYVLLLYTIQPCANYYMLCIWQEHIMVMWLI